MTSIGDLHLEGQRKKAAEVLAEHQPWWTDDGTDTDDTPVWLGCKGCMWAAPADMDDDEAEAKHREHVIDVLVGLRVIH